MSITLRGKGQKPWISLWAMETFPNDKESIPSDHPHTHIHTLPQSKSRSSRKGKGMRSLSLWSRVFSVGSLNKREFLWPAAVVNSTFLPPSAIPAWTNSLKSPELGKKFHNGYLELDIESNFFPAPFCVQGGPSKPLRQLAPRPT